MLRDKKPDKYKYLVTILSEGKLGLSENEIERVVNGDYPLVELFRVY